jgi:uncharacterized radical SAM superfamily protein
MIQPVLEKFSDFACDMNGSHVLRSMLSVLAGIPVIAERKSKTSKHVNSIQISKTLDSMLVSGGFHIDPNSTFPVPEDFHGKISSLNYSILQ